METKKYIYKGIEVTFMIGQNSFHYSFYHNKTRFGDGVKNCLVPISEANMRSIVRRQVETVLANVR